MLALLMASVSYAYTPTYPLANITVYKLSTNLSSMGYDILVSQKPSAITPDGFPMYGLNIPDSSLIQSSEFANTIMLVDKSGSQILGIQLFFNRNANVNSSAKLLSKIVKALDENNYNKMTPEWVEKQMIEFMSNGDKSISHESMGYRYSFKKEYTNGNKITKVTIEAGTIDLKAAEENYNIGNKYRWNGNSSKAVEYLEKAVQLANYTNSVHLFVLGHAYSDNKQYQKSIDSYSKALALFKKESRYGDVTKSYYLIGACYEKLNNKNAAIEAYKNAAIEAYKNAVAQNQDNNESKAAKQRLSTLEK